MRWGKTSTSIHMYCLTDSASQTVGVQWQLLTVENYLMCSVSHQSVRTFMCKLEFPRLKNIQCQSYEVVKEQLLKMAIWQRQMETSLYGELLITSSGLILHFLARLDYIHPNKVNLANISAILLQACSINYQEDSRYEGTDQKITAVVFTSCSAGRPSSQ